MEVLRIRELFIKSSDLIFTVCNPLFIIRPLPNWLEFVHSARRLPPNPPEPSPPLPLFLSVLLRCICSAIVSRSYLRPCLP
jgi:hypothetical protein